MSDKNDNELLKMAAKAAGVSVNRSRLDDLTSLDFLIANSPRNTTPIYGPWNPLTDDGDALRLAVKLGIVIDTSDGVHAQYIVNSIAYPISEYEFINIYVTTRRAITRAAAEIGRAMS